MDGFPATRWASDYTNNSWFQVDLGESMEFDTVNWEYARARTYKLLVSDDKQNWTSVIKNNEGIFTARDGKESLHFEPIKARYVKFQGLERNTDYGYSFYEFEFGVYNLAGGDAAAPIDGVRAVADIDAGKLTIDGLIMNRSSQSKVKLQVLDSKGKVRFEGQTTSTVTGSFHFSIKLTGFLKGTNVAYLSMDGMTIR